MITAEGARERVRSAWEWVSSRPPRVYLVAGWVVFVLGCYPGYMSFDSTMQLYNVRNGNYADTYAPLMTAVWSLLEYIAAGPFPMLVLQSGLFLFGLAAILRTQLSPRAAALTAVGVALFPPVYCVMAVIWRESLLAGALLAATGALLQATWRWRVVGGLLFVLACSCRPEAGFAIVPLALLAVRDRRWYQRAAIALAITIGASATARLADAVLTDTNTYVSRQSLLVVDIVGTLRRARVTDPDAIAKLLPGLQLSAPDNLRERMAHRGATLDWWPLTHGDRRVMDEITTEAGSDALTAAWRNVVTTYPGAYYRHRVIVAKHLLGLKNTTWLPIYDGFGDPDLMGGLHHRATTSDWQVGMRAYVRLLESTPLFRPWLYVLVAIALVVITRRRPIPLLFVVSGLAYELGMCVFAPVADYRLSHWLVTATSSVLATVLVARRWRRVD